MGISYLDGPRLRRSLVAAAEWVEAAREELNRINVFPVPDGDTGTNFALTLRAVAQAVDPLEHAPLPHVTKCMADACVLSAHGNSGMLLSHFLLGFREAIGERDTARPADVAAAFRAGSDRLSSALDEPVEGTILTVCRDAAEAAEAADHAGGFEQFLRHTLGAAELALARTPELLAPLKEAGVVDAGGMGFVRLLEGILRLIEGAPTAVERTSRSQPVGPAATARVAPERDYRFCTEVLVRGSSLPPSAELRAALRALGGSIVVLATDHLLRVHIHTDAPASVFDMARGWGSVESTKADDMRTQHESLGHETGEGVAIVVDSSCDLSDEVIDRCGFIVTPIQISDEQRTYLDRVEIRADEIYRRMRSDGTLFTTSQPPPSAFAEAFRDARSTAREALCVVLSGGLSGTIAAAQAAAATIDLDGLHVFDSRSVSLGLGMLALRAHELTKAGLSATEAIDELTRVRDRSGAIVTVDQLKHLVRSGRVGRGRAWLGSLLDIKPILELTPSDGKVSMIDRVRGESDLTARVLAHLDRRLTPRPRKLRLGVAHAGAPWVADRLVPELERKFRPHECLVANATAALGVHVGPGAWAVFYQIEEPADPHSRTSQTGSAP